MAAPSPSQASPSSPQRSAATSRVSAGVPRSERTQRMSVLVTTQTKVSSGVGFQFGRVEEQHQGFVGAELGLHLLHRQRLRPAEGGVVGEVRRQPLVDVGNARVDGGKPGDIGRLSGTVPLVGRLRHGRRAHPVPLLPFLDQVLPFAHDGRQRRDRPWPRAPPSAPARRRPPSLAPIAPSGTSRGPRPASALRAACSTQGDAPP